MPVVVRMLHLSYGATQVDVGSLQETWYMAAAFSTARGDGRLDLDTFCYRLASLGATAQRR